MSITSAHFFYFTDIMNKRRNFLKTIGIGALAVTSKQTLLASPQKITQTQSTDFAFKTPPYIQNNIGNQITVMSITNKPALCWIEILNPANEVIDKVYQSEDGMIQANTTLFKFKVEGLRDKTLSYKVKAKEILKFEPYKIEYGNEIESQVYNVPVLETDASSISCIIYNDVHEDTATYQDLLKLVDTDFDFAIFNGDSFHYVTNEDDLANKMLSQVSGLFAAEKMFVMNRGNHETRGAFARDFKKYFDYQDNKFYQAFKLGPIFWIFLDGGEDKPDSHEVYASTVDYDNYREEQALWLGKVVQSEEFKNSPFKIVVNHIPAFHSDDWHGTLHNRKVFHPILQQSNIDAVLSGHTHRFGFYDKDDQHNYPIFIGGGPKGGNRTIIQVKASNNSLNIQMLKDDGSVIHNLNKKI